MVGLVTKLCFLVLLKSDNISKCLITLVTLNKFVCMKGARGSREKSPWQMVGPATQLSFLVLLKSHNISQCMITLVTLK